MRGLVLRRRHRVGGRQVDVVVHGIHQIGHQIVQGTTAAVVGVCSGCGVRLLLLLVDVA